MEIVEQATKSRISRVEIGHNDIKRLGACIPKRAINELEQECKARSTDWIQLGSVNLQDMRLGVAP